MNIMRKCPINYSRKGEGKKIVNYINFKGNMLVTLKTIHVERSFTVREANDVC